MRTSIYIKRDGKHIATEYANNADEAWLVLNKYVLKYVDDTFECEPLILDGGQMRPFWSVRFVSHIPLLCDDLDQLPF